MKHVTPLHRNKKICSLVGQMYKKSRHKYNRYAGIRRELVRNLKKVGFVWWNSGGFKYCYRCLEFPEFVIKVYKESVNYTEDTCLSSAPKWLRKHILYPIFKNRMYMIQPLANGKRGNWKMNAEEALCINLKDWQNEIISNRDIMSDNVKFHRGKPVVIDFC